MCVFDSIILWLAVIWPCLCYHHLLFIYICIILNLYLFYGTVVYSSSTIFNFLPNFPNIITIPVIIIIIIIKDRVIDGDILHAKIGIIAHMSSIRAHIQIRIETPNIGYIAPTSIVSNDCTTRYSTLYTSTFAHVCIGITPYVIDMNGMSLLVFICTYACTKVISWVEYV